MNFTRRKVIGVAGAAALKRAMRCASMPWSKVRVSK